VAWVVAALFVRFLEDNAPRDGKVRYLAGDSLEGVELARDQERAYYRSRRDAGEREYVLWVFEKMAHLPGLGGPFSEAATRSGALPRSRARAPASSGALPRSRARVPARSGALPRSCARAPASSGASGRVELKPYCHCVTHRRNWLHELWSRPEDDWKLLDRLLARGRCRCNELDELDVRAGKGENLLRSNEAYAKNSASPLQEVLRYAERPRSAFARALCPHRDFFQRVTTFCRARRKFF